jgi:hypothetical protein
VKGERIVSAIEVLAEELREQSLLCSGTEVLLQVQTSEEVDALFRLIGAPVGAKNVRPPVSKSYSSAVPGAVPGSRIYRSATTEVAGLAVRIIGGGEAA